MEELRSCPFCGGRAAREETQRGAALLYRISCQSAFCRVCTPWKHSPYDAVAQWNQRTRGC